MSRFVAWMPDEGAQAGLMALRQELDVTLPNAGNYQWRAAPQLHMTLRFLGYFSEDVEPELKESLAVLAADASRIVLQFDRVEYWPSSNVLVARPTESAQLNLLLHQIDSAASAAGYTEYAGTQTPHVTLAYADKRHPPSGTTTCPSVSSLEAMLGHISIVTTATGGYTHDAWWPLQDPPFENPDYPR